MLSLTWTGRNRTIEPKRGNTMTQRQEVRVKPHDYQPTKAEQEERWIPRMKDGSRPTTDEFAKAVFRPKNVVEDSDA